MRPDGANIDGTKFIECAKKLEDFKAEVPAIGRVQ
jgi:hypothetical protein